MFKRKTKVHDDFKLFLLLHVFSYLQNISLNVPDCVPVLTLFIHVRATVKHSTVDVN